MMPRAGCDGWAGVLASSVRNYGWVWVQRSPPSHMHACRTLWALHPRTLCVPQLAAARASSATAASPSASTTSRPRRGCRWRRPRPWRRGEPCCPAPGCPTPGCPASALRYPASASRCPASRCPALPRAPWAAPQGLTLHCAHGALPWTPRSLPPAPCSYDKCGEYIQQHRKGMIELAPGCNADQSLEAAVTGVLNNIREQAAKVGGGSCPASQLTLHLLLAPVICLLRC